MYPVVWDEHRPVRWTPGTRVSPLHSRSPTTRPASGNPGADQTSRGPQGTIHPSFALRRRLQGRAQDCPKRGLPVQPNRADPLPRCPFSPDIADARGVIELSGGRNQPEGHVDCLEATSLLTNHYGTRIQDSVPSVVVNRWDQPPWTRSVRITNFEPNRDRDPAVSVCEPGVLA